MITKHRHTGLTLPEMTVVISIAALMVGLTIPAVNMLLNSFESQNGAKSTISAAMSSARAIAAKEQRYAGIRFQKRYDPANPDPLNESQYIIFIIQDTDRTGLVNGFRAVEGIQPIKLPDSIGVMDLYYDPDIVINPDSYWVGVSPDYVMINNTTFSIVFSPSGKLAIHDVQTRNRDGIPDSTGRINDYSNDDIFNKKVRVDAGLAMFYQDDYFNPAWSAWPGLDLGLGLEASRTGFVIYDTKIFKQTSPHRRWPDYIYHLKAVFINPYTGMIVNDK
jgi:hypothetical protein